MVSFSSSRSTYTWGDPESLRRWDEQVHQRQLAMAIPAVSNDDARTIELETPGTKV
jgi:hypothetical protein